MPAAENLDVFLDDFFASDVSAGRRYFKGILDAPAEIIANGTVLSTDYRLTCKASDAGTLKYEDSVTVDGVAYTVRENTPIDDGKMCVLSLTRT